MRNKDPKYYLKYFLVGILFLAVCYKFFTNSSNDVTTTDDPDKNSTTTKIGTFDRLSKKDTTAYKNTNNQQNRSLASRNPASQNDQSSIPHQDSPIINLLERFEIDPKNDFLNVGYDTWFISSKYSIVPISRFNENMGTVVEKTSQHVVAELFSGNLQEKFPPLVISYSTGNIIPLTGDILIKYEENVLTVKKFLSQYKGTLVIDNKELRSINLLQLAVKRKNEIFQLYELILSSVGKNNIVSVELEQRHLARPY